jgi:hypothetical protein
MTLDDLLHGNTDLLTFCARLIESQPATSMAIRWTPPLLDLVVSKIDRVDVYVDGRPLLSHNIADGVQLSLGHPQEVIRIEGYQGQKLQQVRTVRLV